MITLWHPNAKRVIIPQAPQDLEYGPGKPKLVIHTTEPDEHPRTVRSTDIDGAVGAYRSKGDCPTFTIMVVNGKRTLYQHLPMNRAASALEHRPGTQPTNTAGPTIQVEVVEFAAQSAHWSKDLYHYLNLLALFVHRHVGVPLKYDGVSWSHPQRIQDFANYTGICGHMHVPNNSHIDPGVGFHPGYLVKT